jgi:hypothetical protein
MSLDPMWGFRKVLGRPPEDLVSADSYRDAKERPFIHLVDGGVSDNTGLG